MDGLVGGWVVLGPWTLDLFAPRQLPPQGPSLKMDGWMDVLLYTLFRAVEFIPIIPNHRR